MKALRKSTFFVWPLAHLDALLNKGDKLPFQGAAGGEKSRKSFVFRAGFLVALGRMRFRKVFQQTADGRVAARILCVMALLAAIPPLRADDFRKVQRYSVRMFSYGTLTINTRMGDIDIEGWDNPRLAIEAEKMVTARSKAKAQKLYGRLHVRLVGRDHKISLTTRYPKRRLWRPFRDESKLTVNFTIRMPYDANVHIKCVDGDVTVSSMTGQVFLFDNYGDVEVDVPQVYALRVLEAHTWLGYVQSDLHGTEQDSTGFEKNVEFVNPQGSQVIVVRVHMGGIFIYGNDDWW